MQIFTGVLVRAIKKTIQNIVKQKNKLTACILLLLERFERAVVLNVKQEVAYSAATWCRYPETLTSFGHRASSVPDLVHSKSNYTIGLRYFKMATLCNLEQFINLYKQWAGFVIMYKF